jgi:hypothetical protein
VEHAGAWVEHLTEVDLLDDRLTRGGLGDPPTATSTVSTSPVSGGCTIVPGQSSHENAIIAIRQAGRTLGRGRAAILRARPCGAEEERHRNHGHDARKAEGRLPG